MPAVRGAQDTDWVWVNAQAATTASLIDGLASVFVHTGRDRGRIGHHGNLVGGASGFFGEAGLVSRNDMLSAIVVALMRQAFGSDPNSATMFRRVAAIVANSEAAARVSLAPDAVPRVVSAATDT